MKAEKDKHKYMIRMKMIINKDMNADVDGCGNDKDTKNLLLNIYMI